MPSDNIRDLMKEVFSDPRLTLCFCTLCRHTKSYGHCYACDCKNNQPRPALSEHEVTKMLAAIKHWEKIAIEMSKLSSTIPGAPPEAVLALEGKNDSRLHHDPGSH